MSIKLTTLGSMGWIPTANRHTCCYCLELGTSDTLIVFDAGTGLARFDEPWGRDLLARYSRIILLLSHYHLDHVAGLSFMPYFFKGKEVHLAGPGLSVYGRATREILGGLIAPPFYGRSLMEFPMDLEIYDLEVGVNTIAGLKVETVLQEHTSPSLGIKVADSVCYITDTACTEATVRLATGSRLLLHETWLDMAGYKELLGKGKSAPASLRILNAHASVQKVAEAAVAAAVKSLLLIHLNPAYNEERLGAMEQSARYVFNHSRLARDGESVSLSH